MSSQSSRASSTGGVHLPAAAPENLPNGRLEFAARTGVCAVEVEPALQRYGGRCEGVPMLSQAMLEPETNPVGKPASSIRRAPMPSPQPGMI